MKSLFYFFAAVWIIAVGAEAQSSSEDKATFTETIAELDRREGFIDLYVDETKGKVLAALPAPGEDGEAVRFIYATGLTAGLGSNPIGLDRGNASSGDIVRFRRIGGKVIAEQENIRYQATADRALEKLAVRQSFAPSFLWSTPVLATSSSGEILIDLSGFLTRDHFDLASALKFGEDAAAYSLIENRSMPDTSQALAFPDNVEFDAFLTFDTSKPNAQTAATAADGRSVTLVLHHSLVRLPDDGYRTRAFDPRTANMGAGYYDFSSPLSDPILTQLSRRFRLERVDPSAVSGPVKKPIVFYVDSGAPDEIRQALIEGASWWAEGFEAAGFENAYRVETLPEGAHPLDARYNVINWVHRQTRGWSYGGSVSDPRTGEILKANVILGSQRIRQDRMIFEGLAGASKTGTGAADDPIQISLARIRQLSAHEVGHTLGFAHNFIASADGRSSVMDYPAPWVRPADDGGLDFSQAYASGLGAWDVFTTKWLYSQFEDSADEAALLNQMVEEAFTSGLRYVADGDARSTGTAHPDASVWDNGGDAVTTLRETMRVRQIALDGFGLGALAEGRPQSDLREVIVPIYLYHRYQVAAAAKSIGGFAFEYGVTGENAGPGQPASADRQRDALAALIETIDPAALDLPDRITDLMTPGYSGFYRVGSGGETFASRTGPLFDTLAAADTAATLTLSALLDPRRVSRLAAYERRSPEGLSVTEMLNAIDNAVFERPGEARLEAIARTVQSRFVSSLISLSMNEAAGPDARAEAEAKLRAIGERVSRRRAGKDETERRHFAALSQTITRHLERPAASAMTTLTPLETPPGSPIGDYGFMETCWHCDPLPAQ